MYVCYINVWNWRGVQATWRRTGTPRLWAFLFSELFSLTNVNHILKTEKTEVWYDLTSKDKVKSVIRSLRHLNAKRVSVIIPESVKICDSAVSLFPWTMKEGNININRLILLKCQDDQKPTQDRRPDHLPPDDGEYGSDTTPAKLSGFYSDSGNFSVTLRSVEKAFGVNPGLWQQQRGWGEETTLRVEAETSRASWRALG